MRYSPSRSVTLGWLILALTSVMVANLGAGPVQGQPAHEGTHFVDYKVLTATPTHQATSTTTPWPGSTPTSTFTGTLLDGPECRDFIINGDFEGEDLWPWSTDGPTGLASGRNGSQGAWLGGLASSHAEIFCSPFIPASLSPLTLRFWWRAEAAEAQEGDQLIVFLEHDGSGEALLTLTAAGPLNQWQSAEIDLTPFAGESLSLTFAAHNDGDVPTTFRLDDVEILGCGHFLDLPLVMRQRPSPTRTPVPVTPTPTRTQAPGTPTPTLSPGQWTQVSNGIYGGNIRALAISPNCASDHTIFAATNSGFVFKSTGGGASWVESSNGISTNKVFALAISPNYASDHTLFASGSVSMYKTTNGGTSWQLVYSGLPSDDLYALAVSPNYTNDQTVFAGAHSNGIYRTTNGGTLWVAANSGLTSMSIASLAVSPNYTNDHTIFAGTPAGVFKSTNGGDSWAPASSGLTTLSVKTLAISPDYASDRTVFVGTSGGGVFVSTQRRQLVDEPWVVQHVR